MPAADAAIGLARVSCCAAARPPAESIESFKIGNHTRQFVDVRQDVKRASQCQHALYDRFDSMLTQGLATQTYAHQLFSIKVEAFVPVASKSAIVAGHI